MLFRVLRVNEGESEKSALRHIFSRYTARLKLCEDIQALCIIFEQIAAEQRVSVFGFVSFTTFESLIVADLTRLTA